MIIELTMGQKTIVDDCDAELVGRWKWYAQKSGATFYARTNVTTYVDGKRKQLGVQMHRMIMQPPPGFVVDHINGDGRDNRRCNLRLTSARLNRANSSKHKGKSKFKGVNWVKKGNKNWVASIRVHGKLHYLGVYHDQVDAAKAYDAAAKQFFGEYAKTNEALYPVVTLREIT